MPLDKEMSTDRLVTEYIEELGVPAHTKGYNYLKTAIIMVVNNIDLLNNITKLLYPEIARIYQTESSRIEPAIGHAIEIAWTHGEPQKMDELFGYSINTGMGKPTEQEFIAFAADKIRTEINV
ncbi:MAG: sporulation initiation factor Spo0A C-terminal domain-containing protein [Candidatus Ornithomonoglobus sp.]